MKMSVPMSDIDTYYDTQEEMGGEGPLEQRWFLAEWSETGLQYSYVSAIELYFNFQVQH